MRITTLLLIAALAIAGCGRKGPPETPKSATAPTATQEQSDD